MDLSVPPKHGQVAINHVSRNPQLCAESMPLEPADKPPRGAALVIGLRINDDFHFRCAIVSTTPQNFSALKRFMIV